MWCIWTFEYKLSAVSLCTTECTNYLSSTTSVATPPYLTRPNTPPSVFPQAFLPNSSLRLTQQLTTDYTLNLHVWNEIAYKMNEMVEENRLIKQAVLGTYERMKDK